MAKKGRFANDDDDDEAEKLNERNNLEDMGKNERIILKWILKK
jgi:hypothetical protein